jgi:hypothetical protein
MSLLEEITALYLKWETANEAGERDFEAGLALAGAIVELRDPLTVGEVREYETPELQEAGLVYMIHRDGKQHYDQIEGFIDWVAENGAEGIPGECAGFDGLGLCEWILGQDLKAEAAGMVQ